MEVKASDNRKETEKKNERVIYDDSHVYLLHPTHILPDSITSGELRPPNVGARNYKVEA